MFSLCGYSLRVASITAGGGFTSRQDFTSAPIVSSKITPMIIRISAAVKIERIAASYFSGRATMMPAFVL